MKCILKVTLVCSILSVGGCSSLVGFATKTLTGGSTEPLVGVETEVVAGDKQQGVDNSTATKIDSNEGVINSETVGEATEISGAETVNIDEGIPYWQATLGAVIFFLLGLFSPQLTISRKRL